MYIAFDCGRCSDEREHGRNMFSRSSGVASNTAVETDTERGEKRVKIQMQRMGSFLTGTIGAGLVALMAGSASAAPIAITQAAFSGSETVITFTGFAPFTPITSQYAPDGVTFSAGLFSNFTGGAQNFLPTRPGVPITIDFSSSMLRVGFDVITASTDDLTVAVSAYSGNTLVSTGTLTFATGTTMGFVGVEDATDGIDRLVLTAVGTAAGGFVMDNLRFEGTPIPEPSAALLFPTGLILAVSCIRRRRVSA